MVSRYLEGELLAAAREQDLPQPFQRKDWPLTALHCRVDGPLIWVALSEEARPLTQQLEQVPLTLLERAVPRKLCNHLWKESGWGSAPNANSSRSAAW